MQCASKTVAICINILRIELRVDASNLPYKILKENHIIMFATPKKRTNKWKPIEAEIQSVSEE